MFRDSEQKQYSSSSDPLLWNISGPSSNSDPCSGHNRTMTILMANEDTA